MAARGTFKLANPQGVELTMTITMSAKEWLTLKERLRPAASDAEWYLDDTIKQMVEKAAKEFHFYETVSPQANADQ